MGEHTPTAVTDTELSTFDVIVGMSPKITEVLADEHAVQTDRLVRWDVPDPFGGEVDEYRGVARHIVELLVRDRERILDRQLPWPQAHETDRADMAERIRRWQQELQGDVRRTARRGMHTYAFGLLEDELRDCLRRLAEATGQPVEGLTQGRAVDRIPLGVVLWALKRLVPAIEIAPLDGLPAMRNEFAHTGDVPDRRVLLQHLDAILHALPTVQRLASWPP